VIRQLWVLAVHDLRLVLVDRGAVAWMTILPVVFAAFFGMVVGGGGSDRPVEGRAHLTVVDEDASGLSRAFLDHLQSERLVIVAPGEEGSDIRTLRIPAGFERSVLAAEKVAVRLEKSPGSSMEAGLLAEARITAAVARLLAGLVRERVGVVDVTDPADLIRVESRYAGRARRPPSGFEQSIPGMAVMFVMLVALTYGAASVSAERESGLLRRLVTTPVGRTELVAAKIAGRVVVAVVQIAILVAFGLGAHVALGVPIGDRPLLLFAVLVVFAATVAPIGVAFGALIRDPDRAAFAGVLATMVMAALGGCWWPIEVVSRPLQLLALAFPTGWAMSALHDVVAFGHGPGAVVPEVAVLLAVGAAATLAAIRWLRVV